MDRAEITARVEAAQQRWTEALGAAEPMWRRAPGVRAARFDTHHILSPCPSGAAARWLVADAEDYVESARNAARRVGLTALRRWCEDERRRTLPAEIAAVIEYREGLEGDFATWLAELPPGGRAAVADAAMRHLAPLQPFLRPGVRVPMPAHRFEGGVPHLALRPWARHELSFGSPQEQQHGRRWALLTVRRRDPDPAAARTEAAWLATMVAMARRAVPDRITVLDAGAGSTHRVTVDGALLDAGVEAGARFLAAVGGHGDREPGPWCRTCPERHTCPAAPDPSESDRPGAVGGIRLRP